MEKSRFPSRQRGAALLIAIAAAGLLTALAVELTGSVQDEARLVEAFRDDFRARLAVQAPVAVVTAALREKPGGVTGFSQEWASLGETLRVEGVEVRFRVQDEAAKVNLNALASSDVALQNITAEVLKRVFEEKELGAEKVDNLWDWVDGDEEPRALGAEGTYYQGLPKPYPVKNAPLDSLSELRLVQGFTAKVFPVLGFVERSGVPDLGLSDLLTIYSDGRINVNTADPLILRNLNDELPEFFFQDLLDRRNEEPIEKLLDLKDLPGMNDTIFNQIAPLVTVDSNYFSVSAEAKVGRIRKHLTAILKKEAEGVSILYWRIY